MIFNCVLREEERISGKGVSSSKENLKALAVKYYTSLFSSDPQLGGGLICGKFPILDEGARQVLEKDYTANEVH